MASAFHEVSIKQCYSKLTFDKTEGENCFYNLQKSKDPNRLLIAKRESINRDAGQQSFLFYLLTELGYRIQLYKLYKGGTTTHQLFKVKTIFDQNQEKVFSSSQIIISDDETLKRKRKWIDIRTNNEILAILEREHVVFDRKKARKGLLNNDCSMDRIISVISNNSLYNSKKIQEIGLSYNTKIKEQMKNTNKKHFLLSDNECSCCETSC
ncbi:Uncharacterized protein QTN25_000626 [Entamoeba marina]